MAVIITNMDMPETCGQCRWFSFRGCSGDRKWLFDARCEQLPATQDWYAEEHPDPRGGWIGEDLEAAGKYHGYYYYQHCLRSGTRAEQCPLRPVDQQEIFPIGIS